VPLRPRLRLGLSRKSGVLYHAVTGLHSTVDSEAFGVGSKSFLRAAQATQSGKKDRWTKTGGTLHDGAGELYDLSLAELRTGRR